MAKRKRSSGHPDEGREQQAKRPKTTIAPPSETLVSSKHKKHAQKAQKRKDQAHNRRASEPELGEGTQSKTKAEKSLGKDSKKHDASENGEAPKAKPKRKRKRQGVHQTEQNLTIAVESKVDHASPIATETRVISKPLIAAESEGRLESPIELDLTNRHQSPKAEKATQATDPGKATVRAAKYAQKRAKKIKRKEEKAGERQSEGVKQPPKWAWVQSTGGQMLDADPIFSLDEEHIIIAYLEHIVVYATATSLPLRKLEVRRGHRVAATARLPSLPQQLAILTKSGSIELWNWLDGKRLQHWSTRRDSQHLHVLGSNSESENECMVYTTQQEKDGPWQLWAHLLQIEGAKCQSSLLYTSEEEISHLRGSNNGDRLFVTSKDQLIMGSLSKGSSASPDTLSYTWLKVTCPEWISSLDVAFREQDASNPTQNLKSSLQISVGGLKGSIHIYDDLLDKLLLQEKRTFDTNDTSSRRLHWHRNAVLANKWSKDGNYIISGGQETVLVSWQLDRDRKELLPHLGAPIESITVSPSGASYGIRLANNSAMILSTNEMRPTFSVAGIQIRPVFAQRTMPQLLTKDVLSGTKDTKSNVPPTCLSLSRPNQLLFAVPSHFSARTSNPTIPNASYLQSFDLSSGQELTKQALVRTGVTDLNIGPEGNMVQEPNVTHIAMSSNGEWLASIEEWMPARDDYASLAFDTETELEERSHRREVHLKFWLWNEGGTQWRLVNKINNPHSLPYGARAGRVSGLISDPSMSGFATFGDDGTLKLWTESARRRHGLAVKDNDGKYLSDWHLRLSISVPWDDDDDKQTLVSPRMAWSSDGSVIVFARQGHYSTPLFILDALDGKVEQVLTGLYTGPLLDVAILGKYLLILANELVAWDLVADGIHYNIGNLLPDMPLSEMSKFSHIATNTKQNHFAATVPRSVTTKSGRKGLEGRFAIFDLSSPQPLYVESLREPVVSVLPAESHKGYHVIDAVTNVMTLAPEESLPPASVKNPKLEMRPKNGLKNLFGDAMKKQTDNPTARPEAVEDGLRYVSTHQINEALGTYSQDPLPAPEQMFENVVNLLIGRPVEAKT